VSVGDVNGSDEAITDLADGLNDVRGARVVFEGSAEFGDAADECVVADISVGPDGMNQFFFGEDLSGTRSEFDEDLHDLRFEANEIRTAGNRIQLRLNLPSFKLEF